MKIEVKNLKKKFSEEFILKDISLTIEKNKSTVILGQSGCGKSVLIKVIYKLFTEIKKNPKKYINVKKYSNSNIMRIICDYIAGMTDRYAINLYNQIK